MEMLGNQTSTLHTTLHSQTGGQEQLSATHYQTTDAVTVADMSTGFHNYGVDWEPDTITWYFDGREVFKAATPPDMHKPMYMVANLAVGGDWPGNPDASTPFPACARAWRSGLTRPPNRLCSSPRCRRDVWTV
jgi:beta-glucanase (GH16 family)